MLVGSKSRATSASAASTEPSRATNDAKTSTRISTCSMELGLGDSQRRKLLAG